MNFGDAIQALKDGKKVARDGWNGKGMHLFLVTSPWISTIPDISGGDVVKTSPFICMKTSVNTLVPWLASQTDILAEDWVLVLGE